MYNVHVVHFPIEPIKKYNTNFVPPTKKYIRPKNNTCLGTKTFFVSNYPPLFLHPQF
jgi:hypothetical protein